MPLPPEHVLSAFHAETGATGTRRAQGDQLGPVWDNGIKVGDVVYSQAGPFAAWSAKVRERLSVQGARVSRPVLSSDCLLYTSPSPRDVEESRMPSSA